MDQPSYRRHRSPPSIIQHAIWLYLRFTLSYRDVEELLAERGLEVSYKTVRRWVCLPRLLVHPNNASAEPQSRTPARSGEQKGGAAPSLKAGTESEIDA